MSHTYRFAPATAGHAGKARARHDQAPRCRRWTAGGRRCKKRTTSAGGVCACHRLNRLPPALDTAYSAYRVVDLAKGGLVGPTCHRYFLVTTGNAAVHASEGHLLDFVFPTPPGSNCFVYLCSWLRCGVNSPATAPVSNAEIMQAPSGGPFVVECV